MVISKMNLNLFWVFVIVCENGNFSKASKELFLSQPAVSQMISQLERQLDCKLFIRQSRGVTLTREGEEFYKLVKIGLKSLEEANNRIEEMKLLKWGNLKLGASDTISKYILPEYLKRFSRKYKSIKISIKNGTSKELKDMLDIGEIDLVVGFKPKELDKYEFKKIMTLNEAFVASKEYKENIKEVLDKNNINNYKIMMLDEKSQTRKEINTHLLMQDIILKPDFELANYELLAEFAKQGLGIAILAKELIKDLHVIKSNIDLPKREVGFYYKKNMPLPIALRAFIDGFNFNIL